MHRQATLKKLVGARHCEVQFEIAIDTCDQIIRKQYHFQCALDKDSRIMPWVISDTTDQPYYIVVTMLHV